MADEFRVGDQVRVDLPDSFMHGRVFVIDALNVVSSDNVRGHRLKDGSVMTVVEPIHLKKVK